MSRLTYKSESGMTWFVDEEGRRLEPCEMSPHHSRLAIEKLAHYEDLEEQGRLIELPCKVGDTVYVIDDDYEEMYEPSSKYYFVIEHKFELYMITGIGTWVFLTKAEAEAKLAELKGGGGDE